MIALSLIPLLALAQPAPADQPTAPAEEATQEAPAAEPSGRFLIAPKLGFFKTTTPLSGAAYLAGEVGYITPLLDNRLAIVAEFDYHQPDVSSTINDPQLTVGGNTANGAYTLTEREMAFLLSAVYRMQGAFVDGALTPYFGGGPGLYFHRAKMEAFGNTMMESEGTLGFQLLGGAEYLLGPGSVFAEFHYHFTRVDFLSTGSVNVGGFLAGGLGYRFQF